MDEYREPEPHKVGVQMRRSVHSQVPQKDIVRRVEAASRGGFRKLAVQKESKIEEGHLMPDHVHMMISIPPKYAVSQVIGFIKGKSAIHLGSRLWREGNAILWDSTSGRGHTSSRR